MPSPPEILGIWVGEHDVLAVGRVDPTNNNLPTLRRYVDGTWQQADFPPSLEDANLHGVWGDATGAYAVGVVAPLGIEENALIAFSSDRQTWRAVSANLGRNALRRITGTTSSGDLFAIGVGAIWHCATACNN